MRCSKCNGELPPGDVYCPACGCEIQMVPDYDPLDEMLWDREGPVKDEEKREASKQDYDRKKQKNCIQVKKYQRFWRDAWCRKLSFLAAGLLICLGAAFGAYYYVRCQRDYGYHLEMGIECFKENNMEKAISFLKRSQELQAETEGADERPLFYLSQVYREMGEPDMAVECLKDILNFPLDEKAKTEVYSALFQTLGEAGRAGEINEWIEECQDEALRKRLLAYRIEKPEANIAGGVYHYYVYPELTAAYGTIYYTLDGSEPTSDSTKYAGKISLQEGDNLLTAVAINEKGIASEPLFIVYTLDFDVPEAPQEEGY